MLYFMTVVLYGIDFEPCLCLKAYQSPIWSNSCSLYNSTYGDLSAKTNGNEIPNLMSSFKGTPHQSQSVVENYCLA